MNLKEGLLSGTLISVRVEDSIYPVPIDQSFQRFWAGPRCLGDVAVYELNNQIGELATSQFVPCSSLWL